MGRWMWSTLENDEVWVDESDVRDYEDSDEEAYWASLMEQERFN